jgi:hypothetical protein
MHRLLDHEKLEVYRTSVAFIIWLEPILQPPPKSLSAADQLDRASFHVSGGHLQFFNSGGNCFGSTG